MKSSRHFKSNRDANTENRNEDSPFKQQDSKKSFRGIKTWICPKSCGTKVSTTTSNFFPVRRPFNLPSSHTAASTAVYSIFGINMNSTQERLLHQPNESTPFNRIRLDTEMSEAEEEQSSRNSNLSSKLWTGFLMVLVALAFLQAGRWQFAYDSKHGHHS